VRNTLSFNTRLQRPNQYRIDWVQGAASKDNMGWSGWEEFRNLTPNDKTN